MAFGNLINPNNLEPFSKFTGIMYRLYVSNSSFLDKQIKSLLKKYYSSINTNFTINLQQINNKSSKAFSFLELYKKSTYYSHIGNESLNTP